MPKYSEIYLHIFWHQHQPWYPAPGENRCVMPWVRLHGIKDYYDMAALCQQHPGWKQTINLVPSLIEQLEGYGSGALTDGALELSRKPAGELTSEEQSIVLKRFFDAHAPRMIHPYPRYDELLRKRDASRQDQHRRFSEQDLRDLQVWFNLVWFDPIWLENSDRPLKELLRKQRGFTEEEKQQVLDLQIEVIQEIIPLHRRLYEEKALEITCSPYYHPILPLLMDTNIAQVSNPRDPVPDPPFSFPDDAAWQIREGRRYFESVFGFQPSGMWPSEGSVSDAVCALMAREGVEYFATDEDILFHSVPVHGKKPLERSELFRLQRLVTESGEIDCVFRDHGLSDRIGFVYRDMDPKEAAKDFITNLKRIGTNWRGDAPPLVNVILDGENCWEFYPRDGHDFLHETIEGILQDSQIHPITVPEYRELYPPKPTLKSIFPGSWINHNFRIWIGHQEDNAAWRFVHTARECLVQAQDGLDEETRREAWRELYICEGSDWFWWFGDINSSAHDDLFDAQFRNHLTRLYELIGQPVPETLKRPIKQPKKVGKGGGLFFQKPKIDGEGKGYYDWVGARVLTAPIGGGAMHQAGGAEAHVQFGRIEEELSFSIQFSEAILDEETRVSLCVTKPTLKTVPVYPADGDMESYLMDSRLMGTVNLNTLGVDPAREVWFFFQFEPVDAPVFSIPHGNELYLPSYSPTNTSVYWFL